MTKELRIEKIAEIVKGEPFAKMEIPWQDQLQVMNVYKIPLNLLVYNKYNGRILSRTKSLERQNMVLNPETEDGKKKIEDLLWESNVDRNRRTMSNIDAFGQQKIGIITKDGIIIDGNRRAMLLNKIQKYDYFKAVVLPVSSDESVLEIEKLETSFQMGEDEKLSYNATEKYIKAKEIYLKLTGKDALPALDEDFDNSAVTKISDWMGEKPGEIKKYLATIKVMDEYLSFYEYDGIYTQLDNREDQFLSLQKWLNTYYSENSLKAFDGYTKSDVDDLKVIAFDYIRIRNQYDGKLFRLIADGFRDKHFFGNKNIWEDFRNYHFQTTRSIKEGPIDYDSPNIKASLDSRDKDFFDQAYEDGDNRFLSNLSEHGERLKYLEAANAPEKLIKKAKASFESINTGHSSFSTSEVQKEVAELGDVVFGAMLNKSPINVLKHIVSLLSKINSSSISSEKDDVKKLLKEISSKAYNINREL